MTDNYQRGRSYSYSLNRFLYRDILHDAFLAYYTSSGGKNLFEQHIGTVIRTIKLIFWGYYTSKRVVRNQSDRFVAYDDHCSTTTTAEELYIAHERLENLITDIKRNYPRTSDQMIECLNLKMEGYEQQEIAEKLGVAKSNVTYTFNKIRKMQSPFAGDKIKVSKKITRKTYEENKEKYGDYKYDPEKGCDFNEFFMTMVGPNGDYLLIKE